MQFIIVNAESWLSEYFFQQLSCDLNTLLRSEF